MLAPQQTFAVLTQSIPEFLLFGLERRHAVDNLPEPLATQLRSTIKVRSFLKQK
jgi:hypothetical protein